MFGENGVMPKLGATNNSYLEKSFYEKALLIFFKPIQMIYSIFLWL